MKERKKSVLNLQSCWNRYQDNPGNKIMFSPEKICESNNAKIRNTNALNKLTKNYLKNCPSVYLSNNHNRYDSKFVSFTVIHNTQNFILKKKLNNI